jgi:hypothetical protein
MVDPAVAPGSLSDVLAKNAGVEVRILRFRDHVAKHHMGLCPCDGETQEDGTPYPTLEDQREAIFDELLEMMGNLEKIAHHKCDDYLNEICPVCRADKRV